MRELKDMGDCKAVLSDRRHEAETSRIGARVSNLLPGFCHFLRVEIRKRLLSHL